MFYLLKILTDNFQRKYSMGKESKLARKSIGKVYTPKQVVTTILDLVGYNGAHIIGKNIIDNSCGDGQFLIEIAKRYCEECLKLNKSNDEIQSLLEANIYGIEINQEEKQKCINNLNNVIKDLGLNIIVNWNVICANTLTVSKYNKKMDYVVGNPPYVRIHNIADVDLIKRYAFSQDGMTDLYIPFFEIGINMLNDTGRLGYITPNSYFNSNAAATMRKTFLKKKLLTKIIDYKHKQLFNATTYTAITVLDKNNMLEQVEYYEFDDILNKIIKIEDLDYNDFYIENNFYFSNENNLSILKRIKKAKNSYYNLEVKNGFATLADKVFIGNFGFSDYCIPIIKASTGKKYTCIYPYIDGKLINEEILEKTKDLYEYLKKNKELLSARSLDKRTSWYAFGRSQGILDTLKNKYSINNLVKQKSDIKLLRCPKGVGVYSGLYIITELDEEVLKEFIVSDSFIKYISLLGKYKSGGYYTFSSKELKKYLEFKCLERFGSKDEQLRVFASH